MEQDYDIEISPDDDKALAVIQGTVAEKDNPELRGQVTSTDGKVELLGRWFRVADKVGIMPLLKFASASDIDTEDPRALSAMYSMLQDSIHAGTPACGKCAACRAGDERKCAEFDPGDWKAFEQHAIEAKAEADDLFEVVSKVLQIVTGRPTRQPSSSSPGRPATSRRSTGTSSAKRGRASRR